MTPNYQLLEAVKCGNKANVKLALSRGASVDCRDFNDRSVLEVAEKYHQNELVGLLVSHGADPNQRSGKRRDSLLHSAVRANNLGFADALLECGASVDAANGAGLTPLHIAARKGNEYLADLLIGAGANVDATDPKTGNTPFHFAAINGEKSLLRLLLSRGADSSLTNKTGYTPLHEAAAAGHTLLVNFLIDRCYLSPSERRTLLPRVRLGAELHGHAETVAVLHAAEQGTPSNFADRVRESKRVESSCHSRTT